jgi:hypothetical protein
LDVRRCAVTVTHRDSLLVRGTADNWGVRLQEFWSRMGRQFGPAYAESVAGDHVLSRLGGRTVSQALAEGSDAKDVWRAVCEEFDVPAQLR